MPAFAALDQRCINAIRFLAADAVEKAGVGHLGTPLGAAPMAYVLWDRFLRHDPKHPGWPDRDRFVLSCGHAALLHYALLHLTGYDLALDEFKRFRQFGSQTPGHPEYRITSGIEATTGPLGQGFSIAAGMAMAEAFLARRYNRPGYTLINHHTYALVSDGDMQEGVSSEAASLAGTLGLSNLIAFYDDNDLQIEGPSDLAFHEDVAARFRAYGWRVIDDIDGQDLPAIEAGLRAALAETQRPSLIVVRTRIGYGSPVENTAGAHHGPLGEQALRLTKKRFGWPEEPSFWVPSEVQAHMRAALERGGAAFADWTERLEQYRQAFPAQAKEFERSLAGELPAGWEQNLESALQELPQRIAPRKSSERILQRAAASLPDLIGGAADLGPSTCTYIKHESDFNAQNFAGRNLHFGV
ncbi:MAG TPA: transketolase, partial [Paracoccaceae bacterium]